PPSVQQLTRYPEILRELDAHLPLTAALGAAYRRQPDDVWRAIDAVRAKIDQAVAAQPTTAVVPGAVAVSPYVVALGTVATALWVPAVATELTAYYATVPQTTMVTTVVGPYGTGTRT